MAGKGNSKSFETLVTSNINVNDHPQLANKITAYITEIENGTADPSEAVLAAILDLDPSDSEAQIALHGLTEQLQDSGLILAITSDGGGQTAQVTLDENTTSVTTVQAADPQGDPITYDIAGGADAALFTIDPATGALTFATSPDFENPSDTNGDNTYEVTVRATDPVSGQIDTQVLTVSIADVNEAPIIAPGGDNTGWVDEDGEDAPTVVSGQLTASDPDAGAMLAWSVAGGGIGGYGSLAIDDTGQWTYVLDNDSDAVQALSQTDDLTETFEIVVQDEHGLIDSSTVTITVTGSDDGPVMENFFVGSDEADRFVGFLGNTEVMGLGGDDQIVGDVSGLSIRGDSYNRSHEHPGRGGPGISGPIEDIVPGHDIIDAGSGNDTVYGDHEYLDSNAGGYSSTSSSWVSGSDTIFGGTGEDEVYGEGYQMWSGARYGQVSELRGGDDVIDGGDGNDSVYGDAQRMQAQTTHQEAGTTAIVTGGDDTVSGGDGNDQVSGDGRYLTANHYDYNSRSETGENYALGGNDEVNGDAGNDILYGDAYSGTANAFDDRDGGGSVLSVVQGGDDTLDSGTGNDVIYGDFEVMNVQTYDPDDIMWVRGGNDLLGGGAGNDRLYGDAYRIDSRDYSGSQSANFTGGDDTLEGGEGNDHMWGDFGQVSRMYQTTNPDVQTGADVFVFNPGSGLDVIHDFEVGQDHIDLTGYGVTDMSELDIAYEYVRGQWQAVIDLDGTAADVDEITFLGVDALSAGDFIFA